MPREASVRSMSDVLYVLRDPPLDGPTNMARDEALLHAQQSRPAVIRVYAWSPPTISLGYFQPYSAVAALPASLRGLAAVRRITGGGAILHDAEVTYCLALSHTIPTANRAPTDLYRVVHDCWLTTLRDDGIRVEFAPEDAPLPRPRGGPFFCFERPGRTDLVSVDGAKMLGSAQRRLPTRLLQHGSLILARRYEDHPSADLDGPSSDRVDGWIDSFLARLGAALSLTPTPSAWTDDELRVAATLRERYAGPEWMRKH